MSDSNSVTPFNMADVQQRVSDSIKSQFAMMIPDEAFNAMAQTAINDFFSTEKLYPVLRKEKEVPKENGYGTYTRTTYVMGELLTPFKAMLWEEVRVITEAKLKQWTGEQSQKLGEAIQEFFQTGSEFQGTVAGNIEKLAKVMAAAQQMTILEQANGMATQAMNNLANHNGLRLPGQY